MAYDSYYDTSGAYEPPRPQEEYANEQAYNAGPSYNLPYPSQHVSDHVQMPQPRMPSPPPPFQSPTNTAGNAALYGHVSNDAAFAANSSDHPAHINSNNFLSPELISQVTATVIQQLKAYGLEGYQGPNQAPSALHPPPPPHPAAAPAPSATEQPVPSLSPSASPGPEATYYNTPAPHRDPQAQDTRGPESISAPIERLDIPIEKRSGAGPSSEPRTSFVGRAPTQEELTTLEKIWGKLFDDGKPTARLSQLLRGIAVHLIEDYPPGNTIVVVPNKMQKYYADTKVSTDTYPWQDIFDDRTSSISRIYRDIEAEHHLVQNPKELRERPDIPGLTPRGFEKWYTLMIQANPEREYARLQKTVLAMPISNPDDKKERFPKELPRRLLPSSPDLKLLEKLEISIITHCEVELPRSPPPEPSKSPSRRPPIEKSPSRVPPINDKRVSVSPAASNSQERESRSKVLDEKDEESTATTPRPIERERKPYSAQPGGGKVYEDSTPATTTTSGPKPESNSSAGRQSQTYSQEPPYTRSSGGTTLTSTGPTPTSHSGHAHHGSISQSKAGRKRSSSVGIGANKAGDYRHSEPDLSAYEPTYLTSLDSGGHHYKTSLGATPAADGYDDDRLLYREYDRDDSRDYEALRERERERERRYHDHLDGSGRSQWSDEDYYRGGLLGGHRSTHAY